MDRAGLVLFIFLLVLLQILYKFLSCNYRLTMLKIYTRENKVKKKQRGNTIYIGMNVSPVRQMVFLAANQEQHPSMFNLCSIQPHTLIVHRYVIFIWRGLLIDKRQSFWFYSNNMNALNLSFIPHSWYQSFFLATSKTISYKRAIKLKRRKYEMQKSFLSDDFL